MANEALAEEGRPSGPSALLRRQWQSLSGIGLALGTLFFAASLTPTLVPRSPLTQGALAGACLAVGYGTGVLWRLLWRFMELPEPHDRLRQIANRLVAAASAAIAILFLWQAAGWQNSIRAAMGMVPVDSGHPFRVSAIALATFAVLLILARLFRILARALSARIRRFVPRRVAAVLGVLVAGLLVWSLASNLLIRTALRVLDASFSQLDGLFEPDRPQPSDPGKTGGRASLVRWAELGRAGREFIASGPSAAVIGAFTGRAAREPLRVYVGLAGGHTAKARARLALEELKRQGGFERSVLIVITPTGTGWVDPSAMDAVEYLHDGDVASVAVQYSYLSSPLSLLTQPEYGAETARALFLEIYGHWTSLPHDRRPRLYLHGLSLGAMNSERSAELFEMIGDPIAGALWSGPPFESRLWRTVTEDRNEGSPAWLPQFRDGRFVRFMNQDGPSVPPEAPWGPMRIVYLQYASDPITFFDYRDLYRRPPWMTVPPGPDVSPRLRWVPVVTMLQIALDMAVATTTPMGHGHVYAPQHYVEAWRAVTDPQHWTPEALERLKQHLREASGQPADGGASPYDNRGG